MISIAFTGTGMLLVDTVTLCQFEALGRAVRLDTEYQQNDQVPQQYLQLRADHKTAFIPDGSVFVPYSRS